MVLSKKHIEKIEKVEKSDSKLKKGHEPWPEQEKTVMQLGINQIIQKRDVERQELMTEKAGLEELDGEIQLNINNAALAVKAAKMSLASLLFDQKFEITVHKHKNRIIELEHEIGRKNHNIAVFQKQLDEGKPVKKEPEAPMSKEESDKHKEKEVGKNAGQSKEEETG